MVDPEQALFTSVISRCPPNRFKRLYFGAEFCFWRLPKPAECLDALRLAHDHGLNFTLVTPVLSEAERQDLRPLLTEIIPLLVPEDEVLISDWGALDMVKKINSNTTIILGRALSGQKRGPRILDLKLSEDEADYFRQGSWYNKAVVELLHSLHIRRVELDNLLQGIAPLPNGLYGSLHFPYAMVTSSRNCPYRAAGASCACPVYCQEVFTLETAETQTPLLQAGNTQFVENATLPRNLAELGIDRVVWHSSLPG